MPLSRQFVNRWLMSLLWSIAINVILNYGETVEAAHLNLPELCGLSILMSQSHMEVTTVCKTEHKKVINRLLETALGSGRWLNLSFLDTDVASEALHNSPTLPDVSLLSHSCCVSFSILAFSLSSGKTLYNSHTVIFLHVMNNILD